MGSEMCIRDSYCIMEFCSFITVIFFRPTEEQTMRLKIHHGGMFIYQSFTMYTNGQIEEEEWGWDVDIMSYIDFKKLINSVRYKHSSAYAIGIPKKH